eukprot:2352932-Rhodomonas_salina.1
MWVLVQGAVLAAQGRVIEAAKLLDAACRLVDFSLVLLMSRVSLAHAGMLRMRVGNADVWILESSLTDWSQGTRKSFVIMAAFFGALL